MDATEAAAAADWLLSVADALAAKGLLPGEGAPDFERLTGGVSSDIWTIARGGHRVVVKRALAKLRVAQDWRAPVSRNAADAAWLREVRTIVPEAVPDVLYEDAAAGLFAMSYIEPSRAPVWKSELLAGRVDPGFAAAVGSTMGRIHAATANKPGIAGDFANAENFHALRLAPYLEATAERHPALATPLAAMVAATAANMVCLIHGDVSPKNILVGEAGPIILDAECATWGDPAFDLAFCLNHLMLKGLVAADPGPLVESFSALARSYLDTTAGLAGPGIKGRTATLLPGLLLARIDGKSPVEYVTDDAMKNRVRAFAIPRIAAAPRTLAEIAADWSATLAEGRS